MEPTKIDAKLSDGREISIDLDKITQKEWRESIQFTFPAEKEMGIISRVSGLAVDELDKLTKSDYQKIISAYIRRGMGFVNPL